MLCILSISTLLEKFGNLFCCNGKYSKSPLCFLGGFCLLSFLCSELLFLKAFSEAVNALSQRLHENSRLDMKKMRRRDRRKGGGGWGEL